MNKLIEWVNSLIIEIPEATKSQYGKTNDVIAFNYYVSNKYGFECREFDSHRVNVLLYVIVNDALANESIIDNYVNGIKEIRNMEKAIDKANQAMDLAIKKSDVFIVKSIDDSGNIEERNLKLTKDLDYIGAQSNKIVLYVIDELTTSTKLRRIGNYSTFDGMIECIEERQ